MKKTQTIRFNRRRFLQIDAAFVATALLSPFAGSRAFGFSQAAIPAKTLNNGVKMPLLGFGTYDLRDNTCVRSVAEAVLPELVSELLNKYPDKIKICFVGYTDINIDEKAASIREFSSGTTDWLSKKTDDYVRDHINNMVRHSRLIKSGCEKFNMTYFDTSEDFIGTLDQAVEYLLDA